MNPPHLHRDLENMSHSLAERWLAYAQDCITTRGTAHIVLAGGSTPQRLYEVLAEPGYRNRLDWSRVHLYFGDERCVPPDHPDSNYRMVREALLDQIPIPAQQVHPIRADINSIRLDAAHYAQELLQHVPCTETGRPQFDLILLGIGPDGHTASLFPKTCILHEQERLAAAVYVPHLKSWRISLTYPVLRNARALWVLAAGTGKAAIVERIWKDPAAGLPIQALGDLPQLEWHLDTAAAGEITP